MVTDLDTIDMNTPCEVSGYDDRLWETDSHAAVSALRLMEMGLVEGARITKVHAAPLTRDPVAVELNGQLLAMRRSEARIVLVKSLPGARHKK